MFETMNSHSYVGIRNKKSKFRSMKQGVLQGGTISPVLLGFYLTNVVENTTLGPSLKRWIVKYISWRQSYVELQNKKSKPR